MDADWMMRAKAAELATLIATSSHVQFPEGAGTARIWLSWYRPILRILQGEESEAAFSAPEVKK